MKLNSLHEAGHWQVLRSPKKGKMSFLIGGVEDRNRFLKSMKMEDIISEQPFYCKQCGNKIKPKQRNCPQCGQTFKASLDSIIQIADNVKGRSLPDLLNLLKGTIYEQALQPMLDPAPEATSRAVTVSFEEDYGSVRIFRVQIPASSSDGAQGYLNTWYVCPADEADENRIRSDVLENIMSYRTFFKAGNVQGAEEALWGTKEAPILLPRVEDAKKLAEKLNAANAEKEAAPLSGMGVETIEEAAEIPMEITLEKPGKAHDLWRIFIPDINKSLYYIWKKPRRGELYYGATGPQKANKIRKDLKNNIAQYVSAFQKRDLDAMKRAVKQKDKVVIRPNRDDAMDLFTTKEVYAEKMGELEMHMTPASIGQTEKYELRKAKDRLKRWQDARRRKENLGTIDRGVVVRRLKLDDVSEFVRNYLIDMQEHFAGERRLNPSVSLDRVAELVPTTSVHKGLLNLLIMRNDIIVDHLSPDGQLALAIAALISAAALKAGTVEPKR